MEWQHRLSVVQQACRCKISLRHTSMVPCAGGSAPSQPRQRQCSGLCGALAATHANCHRRLNLAPAGWEPKLALACNSPRALEGTFDTDLTTAAVLRRAHQYVGNLQERHP